MTRFEREMYDAALDGGDPDDGGSDCPVCNGGRGAACSEKCARIAERAARGPGWRSRTERRRISIANARRTA